MIEAEDLGPRHAPDGQPLEAKLAHFAKRQASGEIGAEHVRIIREFFEHLPVAVDNQTRAGCEKTLASVAAEHTPTALRHAAVRLAALVNPDGDFRQPNWASRRMTTVTGPRPGCRPGDTIRPVGTRESASGLALTSRYRLPALALQLLIAGRNVFAHN